MAIIVGIKFKNTNKVYYFDPKGLTFEEGDGVIVETRADRNTPFAQSQTRTLRKAKSSNLSNPSCAKPPLMTKNAWKRTCKTKNTPSKSYAKRLRK